MEYIDIKPEDLENWQTSLKEFPETLNLMSEKILEENKRLEEMRNNLIGVLLNGQVDFDSLIDIDIEQTDEVDTTSPLSVEEWNNYVNDTNNFYDFLSTAIGNMKIVPFEEYKKENPLSYIKRD